MVLPQKYLSVLLRLSLIHLLLHAALLKAAPMDESNWPFRFLKSLTSYDAPKEESAQAPKAKTNLVEDALPQFLGVKGKRQATNSPGGSQQSSLFHGKWQAGKIPYTIDPVFRENSTIKGNIIAVFTSIQKKSCILFSERVNEENYLRIVHGDRCESSVGFQGGAQTLTLTSRCLQKKYILHEVMHAIGFEHEHTRPDRDDYVAIQWGKISPGHANEFVGRNTFRFWEQGEYDYESIMHYPANAFSMDGEPTIVARTASQRRLGGDDLSHDDLTKLKAVYGDPCECPDDNEIKCSDLLQRCNVRWYMAKHCGETCSLCRNHSKRPSMADIVHADAMGVE